MSTLGQKAKYSRRVHIVRFALIADSSRTSLEVGFVSLPDSCAAAQNLQGPATIAKLANIALLNSEAVEEPIPAGAVEVAAARIHPEAGLPLSRMRTLQRGH
jgi:hypothetical protein